MIPLVTKGCGINGTLVESDQKAVQGAENVKKVRNSIEVAAAHVRFRLLKNDSCRRAQCK
jgi:hypothetical protein